MSYLSVIEFKTLLRYSDIKNYKDNAESRHKMIMSLFPAYIEGDEKRNSNKILFRGEDTSSYSRFLIRSEVPPSNLPGVQTIVEESFQNYEVNSNVIFRVTVSPIRRRGNKERFISEPDELEEWITEKLSPALKDIEIIQTKDETVLRTRNRKNFIKLVQIDGIAKIGDVDRLEELLIKGVGRNKSYGCGLLTIREIM